MVQADHILYNAGKAGGRFEDLSATSCLESSLPTVPIDLVIAEFMPHAPVAYDHFNDK